MEHRSGVGALFAGLAPVAQLDRALPSEESRSNFARHRGHVRDLARGQSQFQISDFRQRQALLCHSACSPLLRKGQTVA